jgi:vitellogenic carboxypeptidase-like protein
MEKLKLCILFLILVGAIQCVFSVDSALYLTPYIESNTGAIGRALALVTFPDLVLKGITSYSGYLTVNKQYNSNMFFWYFPAKKNSATAPVVLWQQGGPGASSLYGLFMENGPVRVNAQNKLELRQYSWHENYNVLYIENPVGAGFSFTNSTAGYCTNEIDVGKNLFSAVKQFFQLWPELRANGFYITGESYAGKYIPALGYQIYLNSQSADPADRINLKGMAIGNGVTDPANQIIYADYLYQLGFIDKNAYAQFNQYQTAGLSLIAQKNYTGALPYIFGLINSPTCLFNQLSGFTSPYNYLKVDGYDPDINAVTAYMANSGIANYLHVGTNPWVAFTADNVVLGYLQGDILQSVADWVTVLINNYRVYIYNGQLDLLVSPTATLNYLSLLQFNGASTYNAAPTTIWKVNNEIAGYVKKASPNFAHITVRLAGHMVPYDQPTWALDILSRLTGNGF